MPAIRNIPIFGKMMLVIASFVIIFFGCMIYLTSQMRAIDARHSSLIQHESHAAFYLARAQRSFTAVRAALADLQLSTSRNGNRTATEAVEEASKDFTTFIDAAANADPIQAPAIHAIRTQVQSAIQGSCGNATKMGEAATSPTELAAAQAEYLRSCAPAFQPIVKAAYQLIESTAANETRAVSEVEAQTSHTILISYLVVFVGIAAAFVGAYAAIKSWLTRPIKDLSASMLELAAHNLTVDVPGLDRADEIGVMAKAVGVFKENGLRLASSEAAAEAHRHAAEQERVANERRRAEFARQQEIVVGAIADGLERLSKGDLTSRLSQNFAEEYEKLRADFNKTADSLREAMSTIVNATDGISSGSDQIATASDDLSRRTEQQAANLEETAAALSTITETVKSMATDAGEAAKVVVTTRAAAEASGAVVAEAINAMSAIKKSSSQIGNIIGVIDEIAFQTNLLALNAGVEAARAGDAGRGFAVVASEVRALAQRSAEAAKEITALINASSEHVEGGVTLVDRTGVALREIVKKVAEIDGLVGQISAASREQATSLAEINTAIGQMDQVVQQNAAMVEESTAAAHALKGETQDLSMLVTRFQIGSPGAERAAPRPVAAPRSAAPQQPAPARKAVPMLKHTSSAKADSEQDWQEF